MSKFICLPTCTQALSTSDVSHDNFTSLTFLLGIQHSQQYSVNKLWASPFVRVIAERISARLWMRDLFLQCTYVRTNVRVCHVQECQFAHVTELICHGTHMLRALTRENIGCLA